MIKNYKDEKISAYKKAKDLIRTGLYNMQMRLEEDMEHEELTEKEMNLISNHINNLISRLLLKVR